MGVKIVTIGAGSSYTPEFCEGLIKRYDLLPVDEWWLVDVPEGKEKMDIVAALAKRMVEKAGVPMKIFTTLNQREALVDADFVTTQLRVGQLKAREKDEYIPLKHGMIGQETNGAGGLFKALRTIPIVLDIVKNTRELAKQNAWIINFTNPAGIVSEAVNSLTDFKNFIGVCNVPIHMKMDVAKILDTTPEHITYDAVGLNHFSYFTNYWKDGKNMMKDVLKEVRNPEKSKNMNMRNISSMAWAPEFIDSISVVPSPYHRYYYKTAPMLKEYLKESDEKKVRATVVREVEAKLFEKYKDVNLKEKPVELEQRGGAYYSDVACGVIEAIFNNTNEEHAVNVLNGNKVANLPSDWTIEVTCNINKNGAQKVAREILLPDFAFGLVTQMKKFELQIIKAIKNKSLDDAFLALMINPLCNDDVEGRAMFKELVVAHQEHLKYFNDLKDFLA